MHKIKPWYVIPLLIVCLLVFAASVYVNRNASSEASPAEDIKRLDEKLLLDLQSQDIEMDANTKCLLACHAISEAELRTMFQLQNVNYAKCEKGNCHLTSYTIEAKTSNGKAVCFKLDSGEDGNTIRELQVSGVACDCG